jgi:hypothetical protein
MKPPGLKQAGELCAKWMGRDPGQPVSCRSKAVGRTLELKLPGQPRQAYTLEACAVPRASVRASKRCKPAFLGRSDGGLFPGERFLIDGGKVKNATRTPRPFHAALPVEWVSGRMVGGPRDLMADNAREGRDLLEGLDLPFPHRAGSSPCCPSSSISVVELGSEVRDAYESDALPAGLRARLGRLAKHLAGPRHRLEGLPLVLGPEDFDGAWAIVNAGSRSCETYLSTWHTQAEESAALRKVEKKKERARKSSAKRRASKSAKEGGRRAVQALQRQSRTGRKLSALRSAAGVEELDPYAVGLAVGLAGGSADDAPEGAPFYDAPERRGGRWTWEDFEWGVEVGRERRKGRLSRGRSAGAVVTAGSTIEVQPARGNPDDVWTYSAGVVERVSGSDALVLIGRRSIWLPLRRLKLVAY